jgi:hypothetical protein
MFISRKQAEERLSSRDNHFRQGDAPCDDVEGADCDVTQAEVDNAVKVPEVVEPASTERKSARLMDVSKLDDLINFRPGSRTSRYKGNEDAQAAVAETALIVGHREAGHMFGLSPEQVRAYSDAHGSLADITDGTPGKPVLRKRINATKERLAEAAAARLEQTLGLLTPEKLATIKRVTNIAKVGKDLAVIMEKCTPREDGDAGGVHFHIYQPEINQEENYTVVNVGAKQ